MNREHKYKYFVTRKNGHTFSEVFTLDQIEDGTTARWLGINYVVPSELQRLDFTGKQDSKGQDIWENDCLGGIYESLHVGWCDKQGGWELFTPDNDCMACEGEVHWFEVVTDDNLEIIGHAQQGE